MSTTIDDIANKILENSINRQEAMRRFEELSDQERGQLILRLKTRIGHNVRTHKGGNGHGMRLRAVDQRELTDKHRKYIERLAAEYEDFVPKSKENIPRNQLHFVDQRRAFHLIKELKSLHFQITYKKAEGAYVYDIDGNKYIDISGDMGVNIFGHKPAFIIDAAKNALDQGIPLAGYSETIVNATKLFSEITGHERVLFTQSGTEAVMFAVRIARAATQKRKIVIFEGAYHGLSDAVVAMREPKGRSLAVGPGMLQEFADQIIVLDYGKMEHLDLIEKESNDIAGVLVEPVQSRHPHNQPVNFLRGLRNLTLELGIPFILDEMITGFRVCPRGAQGYFNVKADIATYGKIVGGGLPTGVIAGSAKYMDLVDGGPWGFNDDSMPKTKRVGVAGTHSQNPLKVSTALATLTEIAEKCKGASACEDCTCFQKELSANTKYLVDDINNFLQDQNIPVVVDRFGSLFRFRFIDSFWGITEALFFILLRMNGVETNIQGNCFLTTAHTSDDINNVAESVKKSFEILLGEGFFYEDDSQGMSDNRDESAYSAVSPPYASDMYETKINNSQYRDKIRVLLREELNSIMAGE